MSIKIIKEELIKLDSDPSIPQTPFSNELMNLVNYYGPNLNVEIFLKILKDTGNYCLTLKKNIERRIK